MRFVSDNFWILLLFSAMLVVGVVFLILPEIWTECREAGFSKLYCLAMVMR